MICRECWLIILNTTVSICQQSEHVMNYHDTLLAPSYPTQSLLQAHLTSHTRIAKKQMSMLHSIPFPNYPTSIRILLPFTSPTSKKKHRAPHCPFTNPSSKKTTTGYHRNTSSKHITQSPGTQKHSTVIMYISCAHVLCVPPTTTD
jgi:hypothetical protein